MQTLKHGSTIRLAAWREFATVGTIESYCSPTTAAMARQREDAAFRALYRVTYEAIRDDAALDTQRGWNAINRVNAWTKRHPLEPIHIGTDVITLTVER